MSAKNKLKKPGATPKRPRPPSKPRTPSSSATPAEETVAAAQTPEAKDLPQAPQAPQTTSPAQALAKIAGTSLRPRRRRKRVRIGDALRREGLDEHTIAETYAGAVETLKEKKDENGGIEKLLFDILKECTRHLESSRPTERSGAGDTPVTVQLVHVVPRPERPPTEAGK